MSNRQDKIKQRQSESAEFLIARKKIQLGMFQQAVNVGEHLYEENKDKLSPEEIEQLEAMRAENARLLAEVEAQIKDMQAQLDEANKDAQA